MKSHRPRLEVRRFIAATPERLFDAWTDADLLTAWWGPEGVQCTEASVDARVGGRYRITNQLPDGRLIVIAGEYEVVEPPHRLVFTWELEDAPLLNERERVTVRFEPTRSGTEVVVVHERIADEVRRAEHEAGWRGCLDGLQDWAQRRES